MEWMSNLLNEWGPWVVGVGSIFGILGWAVGLPAALRILSAIIDVLSPILRIVTESIAGAAKWLWNTIVWPALEDIFDNWRTICFVVAVVLGTIWTMDTRMDLKMDRVVDQLSTCQNEMVKLKKANRLRPSNDFFWPFW